MPLDGLRAWIGEVERKLGMRTRVFLVLATIAIGGAGAAIYLAIDTRENAVSESDVQELQERLEGEIAEDVARTPALPPQPAPPQPEPESETEPKPESESKPGRSDEEAATGGDGTSGASSKLQELLERKNATPDEAE
jgi:hypothetical protein